LAQSQLQETEKQTRNGALHDPEKHILKSQKLKTSRTMRSPTLSSKLGFPHAEKKALPPYRRAGAKSVLNNLLQQQRSPESQMNDAKESASSKTALLRQSSAAKETLRHKTSARR
jgi:hypothetical protein